MWSIALPHQLGVQQRMCKAVHTKQKSVPMTSDSTDSTRHVYAIQQQPSTHLYCNGMHITNALVLTTAMTMTNCKLFIVKKHQH